MVSFYFELVSNTVRDSCKVFLPPVKTQCSSSLPDLLSSDLDVALSTLLKTIDGMQGSDISTIKLISVEWNSFARWIKLNT